MHDANHAAVHRQRHTDERPHVRSPQRGEVHVGARRVLHQQRAARGGDTAAQARGHRHADVVVALEPHRAHEPEVLAVVRGQQDERGVGLQHVADALEHAAQELLLREIGQRGLGDRLQPLHHLGGGLHLVARHLLTQQQLVALLLEALVLGDVDHEAAQAAAVRGMDAVAQPDLAAVGGVGAELVLQRPVGGERLPIARQHALAVPRVDDLTPEVGCAEPALDGIAEQLLGSLADERARERGGVGLPHDRVDAVHEVTEPAFGGLDYPIVVLAVVSHGIVAGAKIARHVPWMPRRHARL